MNDFQETQNGAKTPDVSIWDIARLLLSKFYWLLLAGIVAGVGVYYFVTFFITPTYESIISFYVYNSANNSTSHPGTINNSDLQAAESLATTYWEATPCWMPFWRIWMKATYCPERN